MEFLVKKNLRIAATEEIFKRKPDKWDEYSHSLRNKHHKTVVMGSLVKWHLSLSFDISFGKSEFFILLLSHDYHPPP